MIFLIINVEIIFIDEGKGFFETKSLTFVEEMNSNVNKSIEKFLKKSLVTTNIPSFVTPIFEGRDEPKKEGKLALKIVKRISPSITKFVREKNETTKKKSRAIERNVKYLLKWRKNIRFKKTANVNDTRRATLLLKNRIEIKIRIKVKNFTLTSIDGKKGELFSLNLMIFLKRVFEKFSR